MGDDLSYAMFLTHQGQARDLSQQHKLQQVLLTFARPAALRSYADVNAPSVCHNVMKKMKADPTGVGNESHL
jgi:hypothetical protein